MKEGATLTVVRCELCEEKELYNLAHGEVAKCSEFLQAGRGFCILLNLILSIGSVCV